MKLNNTRSIVRPRNRSGINMLYRLLLTAFLGLPLAALLMVPGAIASAQTEKPAIQADGGAPATPLSEEATDPDDNRVLRSGKSVSGVISPANDIDVYFFYAEANQIATIRMSKNGSSVDSYLQLFAPNGSSVAIDDDSGGSLNSLINNIVLPQSGKYRIQASSFAGNSSGAYTLRIDLPGTDADDYRVLVPGKQLKGRVTPNTDRDPHFFQGVQGQRITLRMNRTSGSLDSVLNLFGPDGSPMISDDDSGGNLNSLIADFVLPVSGTYKIVARSLNGRSGGSYTVRLDMGSSNLALNRVANATTFQTAQTAPGKGNDGSRSTRWSSALGVAPGTQWWWVDLGSVRTFNQVKIDWSTAYSTSYFVGWSNAPNCLGTYDGAWYTANGVGFKTHNIGTRSARCVGIFMDSFKPGTNNFSFWELEVYNVVLRAAMQAGTLAPDDLVLDAVPGQDFAEENIVEVPGPARR